MADYRLPGPASTSDQTLLLDDGTQARRASGLPGSVDGAHPGHASDYDPRTLWHRAVCVQEAYQIGAQRAPQAIVRVTGYELGQLLKGLLPGLLMMMGVIGATTVLGGAIGGLIGALAGGVGAAPGAAVGAQAGMDIGVALLTWLGLGFLVIAIGRGLLTVSRMVGEAVGLAWDAHGTPDRQRDVERAGELFAEAVAQLFLVILMAIVARLTMGQAGPATARAAASLEELVASLRSSRLGAGFADWVAANAQSLVRNPRLKAAAPAERVAAGSGARPVTPSQLRGEAPPPKPTPAAQPTQPKSLREQYMGRTPGKNSRTGQEVQERMRTEGSLRENAITGKTEFRASDGQWSPLKDADMSHKTDAVTWWNETGRELGPRSPEVRQWMLDPENYTLDHYSLNRAAGASLGETYLPPKP